MGMNPGSAPTRRATSPVLWAVLGVVCLGTVLGVWLRGSDNQPASVFGHDGVIALLVLSMPAIVVASARQAASPVFRRVFGSVTIALAVCLEIVALAYFNAGRGSADIAFGTILTVGVVALFAAAIGMIRGRPA